MLNVIRVLLQKGKKICLYLFQSELFIYLIFFFHFHRNLATHLINVHSDEKHFKCPQCDYVHTGRKLKEEHAISQWRETVWLQGVQQQM